MAGVLPTDRLAMRWPEWFVRWATRRLDAWELKHPDKARESLIEEYHYRRQHEAWKRHEYYAREPREAAERWADGILALQEQARKKGTWPP